MHIQADKHSKFLSDKLLIKNTVWNLVGLLSPLLAAVVAIPLLIEGMGLERFGILTLAWMIAGYFSLFDFGLGRAITQLVARSLGEGRNEEIPELAWTALLMMAALGLTGGIIAALFVPWISTDLLQIPGELVGETMAALYLLAVSIPLVISTTGLRGMLEAYQRFDRVNLVRIPLGIFSFCGPLLVLPWSESLVFFIGILLVGRLLAWLAYVWMVFECIPDFGFPVRYSRRHVRPLLSFGGWMTVTNVIGPLMVYLDRFVIASTMSVAAVAYYATPHEMVTKVSLIPTAMLGVMFPAFSMALKSQPGMIDTLFERSARRLFALVFPLVFGAAIFSDEILRLWLGPEFAGASSRVMQILLLGIFLNCVSRLPHTLIQSAGRPDIIARFHLLELIPYLIGLWYFVKNFGLEGAALIWTLRILVDVLLLFAAVDLLSLVERRVISRMLVFSAIASLLIAIGACLPTIELRALYCGLGLCVFALYAWNTLDVKAWRRDHDPAAR